MVLGTAASGAHDHMRILDEATEADRDDMETSLTAGLHSFLAMLPMVVSETAHVLAIQGSVLSWCCPTGEWSTETPETQV